MPIVMLRNVGRCLRFDGSRKIDTIRRRYGWYAGFNQGFNQKPCFSKCISPYECLTNGVSSAQGVNFPVRFDNASYKTGKIRKSARVYCGGVCTENQPRVSEPGKKCGVEIG